MSELPAPSLIADLEARQDDALKALEELERRLAEVLAEFGGTPLPGKAAAVKQPRLFTPAVEDAQPGSDQDSSAAA